MSIGEPKSQLPDYAKDLRLNPDTVTTCGLSLRGRGARGVCLPARAASHGA
jgi:hypothetical protein